MGVVAEGEKVQEVAGGLPQMHYCGKKVVGGSYMVEVGEIKGDEKRPEAAGGCAPAEDESSCNTAALQRSACYSLKCLSQEQLVLDVGSVDGGRSRES